MKRAVLIALALAVTLGFSGLGIWQVERLQWKLDLIARVDARVHAAPVAIPAAAWVDPASEAYRRVRLSGTFLPDRAVFAQALTARGAGFWLVVPMRTAQGTVLVNRGFVPDRRRWPGPAGVTGVTGLLRESEPGGGFLRSNDPAGDRWYSRDVAAIAQAKGLGPVAPFFVDAGAPPNAAGYPIGGLTVIAFRNPHLVYALTWFALAALSGFGAWLLIRRRVA